MAQFFIEDENVDSLKEEYLDEIVAGRVSVMATEGQPIALGADCELVVLHPQTEQQLPLKAVVMSMVRKPFGTQVELKLDSTGPKRRQIFEAFLKGQDSQELQTDLVERMRFQNTNCHPPIFGKQY